jgi:hypothetical protein
MKICGIKRTSGQVGGWMGSGKIWVVVKEFSRIAYNNKK